MSSYHHNCQTIWSKYFTTSKRFLEKDGVGSENVATLFLKTFLKTNNWGDFPLEVKQLLNIFGERFEMENEAALVKLHKLWDIPKRRLNCTYIIRNLFHYCIGPNIILWQNDQNSKIRNLQLIKQLTDSVENSFKPCQT